MSKTTRDDGRPPARTTPPRPLRPGRDSWVRRAVLRALGALAPVRAPADEHRDARAMWQVCGITTPVARDEDRLSRR